MAILIMRSAMRGKRRRGTCSQEGGFTLVELMLGMVLFGVIVYVSMSLVTGASDTLTRLFAEFESRKRVLMLQREMAEGTTQYAGYLAASHVSFGPGTGELQGTCVFRFKFPDYQNESEERSVEYVWRPELEAIDQRVDNGAYRRVLRDVSGFSVTKKPGDAYAIRVEIAHRVKGFANPIVRTTEGQARNMDLRSGALEQAIEECIVP